MGNRTPNKTVLDAAERIRRYDKLIQKQTGVAVKPLRFDGYVNLLNKYGTQKDTTENYQYESEPTVADEMLSNIYEGNGLFARIIDAPAEEAMKLGFDLEGVKDTRLIEFYETALDDLDWEEICITAIKWARLFGGSIAVMLVDDGQGIEMPLDWKNVRSVDGIRVYDRSVIQPDYSSMFTYNPEDPFRTRGNTIGAPEYYYINSKYGSFKVHESRCLVFRNGVLPENCSNSIYEMWGMPEYIRIKRAMRDCELAHGNGPKMLERAIQAVYKVQGLSELLQTDAGEDMVIKRLQTIDLARGLLNSIAIDSDGEEYDFKTFTFTGVSEIIDTTCNQLSALTSIPQTILFGRSPAGMNSTGESDMENWYSFVARIQKRMLSRNLRYLLSIIFQAGITTGEIDEVPPIKPKFKPLWSLSELEEAQLEQTRAATQQTRAATAQIYVGMQAVDPTEIRKGLSDSGEFNIETLLDDYSDDELFPADEDISDDGSSASNVTTAEGHIAEQGDFAGFAEQTNKTVEVASSQEDAHTDSVYGNSVGVIVVSNGKILVGTRNSNTGKGELCGPGGHIERWETPKQAALRETEEEFGITPKELIPIGYGSYEPDTGLTPILYLCTDYAGNINCADLEIINPQFLSLEEIEKQSAPLFKPFKNGIDNLLSLFDEEHALISDICEESNGYGSVRADVDWITINGAHIPLDDDGTVSSGGPSGMEGMKFGKANSQKNGKSSERSGTGKSEGVAKKWHLTKEEFSSNITGDKKKIEDEIKSFAGFEYTEIRKDKERSDFINNTIEDNPQLHWNGSPLYRGVGMTDDEFAAIKVGAYIKPGSSDYFYKEAPSSWSSREAVAVNYSRSPDDGRDNRVIFKEGSTLVKNAISREGVTGPTPEAEVIYSGKTNFVIKSIDPDYEFTYENGVKRKVTLVEVAEVRNRTDNGDVEQPMIVLGKIQGNGNFPEKPIDKCPESGIVRVEEQQRADADKDDLSFITVNGTHIPLVEGKAVGGPLKGEDFSKSKSEGKANGKSSARKTRGAKKASDKPKIREPKAESKKSETKTGSGKRQNKGASSKPSSHGSNDRTTGFINNVELEDHFGRHGKALGCSSKEEYQEKGIDLLTKPCTNGIAGYARADGKVVRFNAKTGEYVSGYPGQNLCTYMIPKDNNGVDLSRALAYYNKHRQADEAKFGTLK